MGGGHILALAAGVVFLILLLKKRKKDGDDNGQNNKKEPVKAMSFAGLPIVVLAGGLAPIFIVAIIIAALAVALWAVDIVFFVRLRKKQKPIQKLESAPTILEEKAEPLPMRVEEKAEPAQEAVAVAENDEEDGGELETVTDEKGNVFQIRYVRSFTAKLIQAPKETKQYYEELKNEALSYKKANSRISWHYDAINVGREKVIKFAIRGKTLCVYFALNAENYAETKYKVEAVESKKFEETPCLYRIKNDRRLGYAKDLIAATMARLGVEKGEERHESYADLPYEPNGPLIERGLIKELKVAVNKPQEAGVEKKTNADGDEVILTKDGAGNLFEIRFVKSFTAKLSQSEDLVKNYYSILKNYALSYKNVHTRISWHLDSLNLGRAQVLKFAIRGKTLCVYFALNAEDYAETKYKVEKVESKKFEDVPCLYRIKNDRRLGYAKDLIDALMAKFAAAKGKESNEDFAIPYETTEALLEKGLVKELKTKVNTKKEEPLHSVEASTVDRLMSDEKAESSIEEDALHSRREGKKDIINIDTLSENFNDGDTVDLDALIAKKLVSPNTGYVKVLARGVLTKKLTVELDDFSLQAVKMIVLMGGRAKKVK